MCLLLALKTLGQGKNNLKINRQSHIFTTNRFVMLVKLQETEMTQKPLQGQKSFKIHCNILQFCGFVPFLIFFSLCYVSLNQAASSWQNFVTQKEHSSLKCGLALFSNQEFIDEFVKRGSYSFCIQIQYDNIGHYLPIFRPRYQCRKSPTTRISAEE